MFFHALTFAVARGTCLNPRPSLEFTFGHLRSVGIFLEFKSK